MHQSARHYERDRGCRSERGVVDSTPETPPDLTRPWTFVGRTFPDLFPDGEGTPEVVVYDDYLQDSTWDILRG